MSNNKTQEAERKMEIYRALRTVRNEIEKGRLLLVDENMKPLFTDFVFLLTRVDGAIRLAEMDEEINEIKANLDQSRVNYFWSKVQS